MKIPKRITLYGQTIEIETVDTLVEDENCVGQARYRLNKILLQDVKKLGRPVSTQEQSYCHELVHFILNLSDYEDLCKNEGFVERFSQLLHQALATAEY